MCSLVTILHSVEARAGRVAIPIARKSVLEQCPPAALLAANAIEQYTRALREFAELINPLSAANLVPNDDEDDQIFEAP